MGSKSSSIVVLGLEPAAVVAGALGCLVQPFGDSASHLWFMKSSSSKLSPCVVLFSQLLLSPCVLVCGFFTCSARCRCRLL
eukprot:6150027-Pyramimonas_sp.AAC.1